jgi:homoserine dehydrogenase
MKRVRLWVIGFGTVGQWFARALEDDRPRLESDGKSALIGPGAGVKLAGQGALSDVINIVLRHNS